MDKNVLAEIERQKLIASDEKDYINKLLAAKSAYSTNKYGVESDYLTARNKTEMDYLTGKHELEETIAEATHNRKQALTQNLSEAFSNFSNGILNAGYSLAGAGAMRDAYSQGSGSISNPLATKSSGAQEYTPLGLQNPTSQYFNTPVKTPTTPDYTNILDSMYKNNPLLAYAIGSSSSAPSININMKLGGKTKIKRRK